MLISKFGSITNDMILEFEEALGTALPESYCTFIRKYNGGETPDTNFSINGISSDIKGFYGLGDVKYPLNNVKRIEAGGFYYLPIAFDSFGNEIIIRLSDGSIAFYDHENGKIEAVAEGLKNFFSCCESQPVNKNSVKSVEERERDLIARGRGGIINDALKEMWRAEIKKYSTISLEEVNV